jgi:mono-ADP-ribosyltransferase sirtuin 6
MSGSYASRLSKYKNKGVCGLPEHVDTERRMTLKMTKLLEMVKAAKHIVVLTGAGISTSAGIPDFRGPSGIWTKEMESAKSTKADCSKRANATSKKRKLNTPVVDFDQAVPTLTHRALAFLVAHHKVHFVVTQNVDGLHKRSGLSRNDHAVLHGCVFTEVCEDCRTEHFRDYDVGGMSFQPTGRTCDVCSGKLRDCLLDWEDDLPEFDFERAQQHCQLADLVLTLGTSLRIEPAASLPTLAKQFVIINLQETPYDEQAALIVRAPVDDVMQTLIEGLGFDARWDSNSKTTIERLWRQLDRVDVE